MSASTKLSTSVKALCFLAMYPKTGYTSAAIAQAIGVNASKLRHLLAKMGKKNIIRSVKGSRGGFLLNKKPQEITLQEIYCAIEDRKAFHLDVKSGQTLQPDISRHINQFFIALFADIQIDIENKMRGITLQTILEQLPQR